MQKLLVIDTDGTVNALYDDNLAFLGQPEIKRASEVEPEPDGNGWYVKLSGDPRNGKHAGEYILRNGRSRAEALAFEVAFIQENCLKGASVKRTKIFVRNTKEFLVQLSLESIS